MMVSVHSDVLLLILHLPNATTSTFAVLPTVHKRIPWPACIHLLMSLSLCIPCETQSCTAQTTSRHHCRRRPHSQAVYFTFLFSLVCCMSAYMDPRVETAAGVPRSTDRAKRRGAALAIATGPPSERLFFAATGRSSSSSSEAVAVAAAVAVAVVAAFIFIQTLVRVVPHLGGHRASDG